MHALCVYFTGAQGEDEPDFTIEIDPEEGDDLQKRSNSYAAKKTVAQGKINTESLNWIWRF